MDEMDNDDEETRDPWYQRYAALIGCVSAPLIFWVIRGVLHSLGVALEHHLEYPRFNDDGDEITDEFTNGGWYAIIVALMIAYRFYALLRANFHKYYLEPKDILAWNTWFVALTIDTVFGYAFEAALPSTVPARGLIFIAITALIAFVSYRVYKALVRAQTVDD